MSQDTEGITDGTESGTSKKSNKAEEVVSFRKKERKRSSQEREG